MHWTDTAAIWVIAAIVLFPGYVLSYCCYSFSIQPLQPSSSHYKPDSNAPPSYALSLSASSQFAVNNPGGSFYLALITFPENYVLSAIPTGCVSVSINTVNCTVSGMNTLVANFASVIAADGTQPRLDTVVVNGEACAKWAGGGAGCPRYTPTNPGSTATSSVMPNPTASSSNPSSIPPSQPPSPSPSSSLPSSSSPSSSSSPPPPMSSSLSSSSSPPCPLIPTSGPVVTPTSKSMSSQHSKTGLIVGLTLALALLIFLACLYFLRRRRQNQQSESGTGLHRSSGRWGGAAAAAALFRIKQKGSKLSHSRTSRQNSPNNPYPSSGYDEKVSSNNDSPFLQGNTALARSNSTISTTTVSEKSAAAAMGTGLGMTLIDIPETNEPESSRSSSSHSVVNYFQNENDELERDSDAEFAEEPISTTNIINEQQAPSPPGSKHPWIARAASKSARLHRAVSAASSRILPLHSHDASRRSSQEQPLHQQQSQQQQQSPLPGTRTGGSVIPRPRFPKGGLFFKNNSNTSERPPTRSASHASISIPRPPKSIYRLSSRDGSSSSGQLVVGTIRPEHHQELVHQQRLDQGLTPEQPLPSYAYHQLASGATSEGTAANAAALSAAVAKGSPGGLYRSRSRNKSAYSDFGGAGEAGGDAFINPGPPPQPPAWGMSRSRQVSESGSGQRRGYNQPIHIRPPGPTLQPDRLQYDQEHLQGVSEGGSGLYGYM